ncbi:MAG: hypothetical protein JSV20_05045 [Candidatus Bathyarchaeota archaeon]|nr:MAG: hypothetical protein JSV20_05045 [Candidatus Bathyarchaeota archaeon]
MKKTNTITVRITGSTEDIKHATKILEESFKIKAKSKLKRSQHGSNHHMLLDLYIQKRG